MKKYISKHYRDLPTCTIIGSYIANDGDGNIGQVLCRSKSGQYFVFAWGDPDTSYCENGKPGTVNVIHTTEGGAVIWASKAGLPEKVIEKEFLNKEAKH